MKQIVQKALESAIKKMDIEISVELTPSKGHADFATNIAMKLASKLKKNPQLIAKKIIENIEGDFIEKAEIAGPGFINIFLKENVLFSIVEKILNKGNNYGRGNESKYINVEYISANPTGYLHIGHARGAVLGSTLVNILKFAGNKVDSEYYINDAGNQMRVLAKSVKARYLQELGIDAKLPEVSYGGEDIKVVAKYFKEKYSDSMINKDSSEFQMEAKGLLLDEIKNQLAEYRVNIELYSSEQYIYDNNLIEPTLEKLKNHIYEKDGAKWLDTTSKGDDKDRVLVKTDGKYTYLTPDIAYHDIKLNRGYDELINIWGADHIGYIKRMKVALEYLGLENNKLDILIVQLVKLFKDGKELKMSKRMGTSFTIKELIQEVGVDAARWFMINRSNTSNFVFDINHAIEKSSDNPVFSVQYTYARANQLIEKSTVKSSLGEYKEKEKEIINILSKFPEVIKRISTTHKIHILPQYLLELCGEFNSWYSSIRIIGHENETSLIALAKATKQVINNGLKLLGISTPNKM